MTPLQIAKKMIGEVPEELEKRFNRVTELVGRVGGVLQSRQIIAMIIADFEAQNEKETQSPCGCIIFRNKK